MPNPEREAFIEKITGWLVSFGKDEEFAREARRGTTLDGVYKGKSAKIHRLVRLAYMRGVRRGAGLAWDAKQKITTREESGP